MGSASLTPSEGVGGSQVVGGEAARKHALTLAKTAGTGALAILEPLTEATAKHLAPGRLSDGDWFVASLDKDGWIQVELVHMYKLQGNEDLKGRRSYSTIDGKYVVSNARPSYHAETLMRRFPEQEWLGSKPPHYNALLWRLAPTDVNAVTFRHCIPGKRVIWLDSVVRDLLKALYQRFVAQSSRAAIGAAFRLERTVPPDPPGWVDHPERPLSDYQRVACQMSLGQQGFALYMDRGTGKTAVTIQTICMEGHRSRTRDNKMFRVLVVCPPQVRMNWQKEFQRFATRPGKVVVVRGSQLERIKRIHQAITNEDDCEYSVAIIGYDSLVSSIDVIKKVKWSLAVTDESHFFKSSFTKRWKAMLLLRDCAERRLELTGTPIGNSVMDLWSQLEFLGEGQSGFATLRGFKDFHGVWEYDVSGSGVERLKQVKNVPLLQERLARLSFSVTKEEARLGLPDKVPNIVEVTMTPRQAEWYKQIAEQLALEIEGLEADQAGSTILADNILTKLLRLAQITSGHVKWDAIEDEDTGETIKPARVEQIPDGNPKIDALMEILQDPERDAESKAVVWCCFVEDVQAISRRLTEAGIKHGTYYGRTPQAQRDDNIEAFNNDPEFRVLVCNPQTAGEGLNLIGYNPDDPNSKGYCDNVIFFSQNWSYILRAQAEDRAHRRGTRMPVTITDLVMPGTIDEEIRDRVTQKRELANSISDVKAVLQHILEQARHVSAAD